MIYFIFELSCFSKDFKIFKFNFFYNAPFLSLLLFFIFTTIIYWVIIDFCSYAMNSGIIFPPIWSFIRPITILFFTFGNGLSISKCQLLFRHIRQCFYKYQLFLCVQWNYLHPYDMVLLFPNILVSNSHIKSHIKSYSIDSSK